MAFIKKKWVNVPDPSNPPSIPEGQDALARFDADNMNRIEDGIAKATDHGLGDVAKSYAGDLYPMLEKGCGFYVVSGASDSPTGNTNWVNLLQLTKEFTESEGTGSGVQIVFDSLPVSNNQGEAWIRTIFGGSARNWNRLLHTGNYSNYANARITIGSYVGSVTTNGATSEVVLSFDFEPKLIILQGKSKFEKLATATFLHGCDGIYMYGSKGEEPNISSVPAVWEENSVKFLLNTGATSQNLNWSGKTYTYVAIG